MAKIRLSKSAFFVYWHELMALILVAIALFLVAAFFTYSRYDNSFFYYSNAPHVAHNVCGIVGAHIAALFFYFLGSACLYIVAILIFCAYLLLMRIGRIGFMQEAERFIALIVVMFISATLCNFYMVDFLGAPYPGGLLGWALLHYITVIFGRFGCVVFLHLCLLVCWILLFRFSFIGACRVIVDLSKLFLNKKMAFRAVRSAKYVTNLCVLPVKRITDFIKNLYDNSAISSIYSVADFEDALLQSHDTFMQDPYFAKASYGGQPLANNTPNHQSDFKTATVTPSVNIQTGFETKVIKESEKQTAAQSVAQPVVQPVVQPMPKKVIQKSFYQLPDLKLFTIDSDQSINKRTKEDEAQAATLEEKLERFGILGKVTAIKPGPVVTLYEYQPHIDTKLSKICALEDDLALALQAVSIRIIAPIPGRSVVGFEVANKKRKDVLFGSVVKSNDFSHFKGALPLVLGQDTVGNNVMVDLSTMPHLLVAGSTGSGKSVALNAMLISLLTKCSPSQLRLVLIDPKRLEFAAYADMAHLYFPIIVDPKRAVLALRWVVKQMEERYTTMASCAARNITDFNGMVSAGKIEKEVMPFIVVIIDELADLMMTASKDIEDLIARITQMARAAGIHLIVATQRPSVDVITGLIKVNFPSRISFRVISKIDSRTILDCSGAEKLLGRGDMLFLNAHGSFIQRVHGAYVSDKEIAQVVAHVRAQQEVVYLDLNQEIMPLTTELDQADDQIYDEIVSFLKNIDEVSISLLQRKFRIGFNRSARIIEKLESQGLIMSADGGKTRKVVR